MNEKNYLRQDRDEYLNSKFHTAISPKSAENHFLNFSKQKELTLQRGKPTILYKRFEKKEINKSKVRNSRCFMLQRCSHFQKSSIH